jgi:hypothetical protein
MIQDRIHELRLIARQKTLSQHRIYSIATLVVSRPITPTPAARNSARNVGSIRPSAILATSTVGHLVNLTYLFTAVSTGIRNRVTSLFATVASL